MTRPGSNGMVRSAGLTLRSLGTVLLILALLDSGEAGADSARGYVPQSDDEVVAVLPEAVVALANQSRRRFAVDNASTPDGTVSADERALLWQKILAVYNLAVGEGSPRAYGKALALVESWPGSDPLPVAVRLVKADILQHNHRFDAALEELQEILAVDPGNPRALQMQPQVSLVAGHLDLVADHCRQLARVGYAILALNCQAQLDGLTGNAHRALQQVEAALAAGRLPRALSFELHVTAADIARRLNASPVAIGHYRDALRLNPDSRYVAISYAARLIERGQAADAARFLQTRRDLDNSLELEILRVRALLDSGQPQQVRPALAVLERKIQALAQRGADQPHKLIALYALELADDPQLAHDAALANWMVQKDPSDTLLLARSAAASGHHGSLARLAGWRTRTGLQDYRLDAILAEASL